MRRFLVVLLIALPALAQNRASCRDLGGGCDPQWQNIERRILAWQLENGTASGENESAARLHAENERREFLRKLNHFVEIWNRFVSEYNKGSFNVRSARSLSKAFQDIQADGWPK
jgi:hypothetical protein